MAAAAVGSTSGIRGQASNRRQEARRLPVEPFHRLFPARDPEDHRRRRPCWSTGEWSRRRTASGPATWSASGSRICPTRRPSPKTSRSRSSTRTKSLTVVNKPAGDGHAPGQGQLARDAGQRAPVPLRHALDAGRRESARHRPPSRPRHDGLLDGRQGRAGPSPARRSSSSCARSTRNIWRWSTASRSATATTSSSRSASIRPSARRWPSAPPRTAASRR